MNKELTIEDIQEIVERDESRYLELKQTHRGIVQGNDLCVCIS